MNLENEQMMKTFEQLFHLRMNSSSIDPAKKSRLVYRINREKLKKYHHEHPFAIIMNNPTNISRKTIGTQTQSYSSSSTSLETSSSISSEVSTDAMQRPSSNCRMYIREMLGDEID